MKIITLNNQCVYYGHEEHSFVDGLLYCENVFFANCTEDNTTVYNNPDTPDDFSIYKYDYDGVDFSLSAAFKAHEKEEREKRNALLAETDWWALPDRTMTAEQTQYRQDLRDITDQSGFPTDITWPTKPE